MVGEGPDAFHVPNFAERMEAARIAAPFYLPKLAAVAHPDANGSSNVVVSQAQHDAAVAAALWRGHRWPAEGGREGAGRPTGSPNKRSVAAEAKARQVAEAIEPALDVPFRGDAHALLVAICKDPQQPIELRIEADKAIRFENSPTSFR